MSDKFDKAIPFILEHEGGYVNDPADPGGETNFGICKRIYPQLDIKALTRQSAINIYRADYWRPYMDAMPYQVATKLFDMSVNMGHTQANKILQRALAVDDDGKIGQVTLSAINAIDESTLVQNISAQQKSFYTDLAKHKPTMEKFLKGWLKRASWIPEVI